MPNWRLVSFRRGTRKDGIGKTEGNSKDKPQKSKMELIKWPPVKTDEELFDLHNRIKDYQITHGSLIKLVQTEQGHKILSRPIGVSMFPTLFPRPCFEHALALQPTYNELYVNVAEDAGWLQGVLRELIASDPLTQALWKIHEQLQKEEIPQTLTLGIFRSDYMLHGTGGPNAAETEIPSLKQVELNTFSCAGGTHGNIASSMHHHLAYRGCFESEDNTEAFQFTPANLPKNNTVQSIVDALALAHQAYAAQGTRSGHELAILMPVQPYNVNICDERPIEYGLWDHEPLIPCFRSIFSEEVLDCCHLHEPTKALLYRPPNPPSKIYEISVVYMRAGYDAREYSEPTGPAARFLLERSGAIKCPSLLSHLSTFKKVQQALAIPGALTRFLPDDSSDGAKSTAAISATFAPLYPLDTSPAGQRGRALALNPTTAANHILKPSLEGGGHNVYGADIPAFLSKTDRSTWPHYILMERIEPPDLHNILLSNQGIYQGPVVSELGVFGTVLWRRKEKGSGAEIIENRGAAGWSFKTKARHINEMSVIKGYGCFDCPCLV